MIKKYDDFFNKSGQRIVESTTSTMQSELEDIEHGIAFNIKDIEDANNFVAPEMVVDDKYLAKISTIVIKHLKKRVNTRFGLYPFTLTVNGDKCAMISSETSSFILFKRGIEKVMVFYKGNPLDGKTNQEFAVSTKKLGFLDMIRTAVDLITDSIHIGNVNEGEIRTPVKPSAAPISTICKQCAAIPKDAMKEFLELYEEYTDADIKTLLLGDTETLADGIQVCVKTFGKSDPSGVDRVVKTIHCILCGFDAAGKDDKEQNAMRNVWFFGAGKSGTLAIEIDATGKYIVKEAEGVMDERVDELQDTMDSIYDIADVICKYIKSGGQDVKTLKRELGLHRGLLITGVGGIGKSFSINKAIDDNNCRDLVMKFGSSSTGANEVYKEMYDGNNMLLIYDDSPGMFSGQEKIALWKHALEPYEKDRTLDRPQGSASKNSTVFYNAKDKKMTRQEKYFKEVGKISPYEKEKWIKSRMSKIESEYRSASRKRGDEESRISTETLKKLAKADFKEYEENEVTCLMPDQFIFNGIVIYISNDTYATFKQNVKDSWDAISGRFEMVDISPTRKVVWAWLRRKIVEQASDSSILNENKIIPVESDIEGYSIEDFLQFMDDVMEGKYNKDGAVYGKISYRIIASIKEYIIGGNKRWKTKALKNMLADAAERE